MPILNHNDFEGKKLSFKAGRLCWKGKSFWNGDYVPDFMSFGGEDDLDNATEIKDRPKPKPKTDVEIAAEAAAKAAAELAKKKEAAKGGKEAGSESISERNKIKLAMLKQTIKQPFTVIGDAVKGISLGASIGEGIEFTHRKGPMIASFKEQLKKDKAAGLLDTLNIAFPDDPLTADQAPDFLANVYAAAANREAEKAYAKYAKFLKGKEAKYGQIRFLAKIESGTKFKIEFTSDKGNLKADLVAEDKRIAKEEAEGKKTDEEKQKEADEAELLVSAKARAKVLRTSLFGRILTFLGLVKYEVDENGNPITDEFLDGVKGQNGMVASIIALTGGAKFLNDPKAGEELLDGMDDKWKSKIEKTLKSAQKRGMGFSKLKLPKGSKKGKEVSSNRHKIKDLKKALADNSNELNKTDKEIELTGKYRVPKGKKLVISFDSEQSLTAPKDKKFEITVDGDWKTRESGDSDRVLKGKVFELSSQGTLPLGLIIAEDAKIKLVAEAAKPKATS
jgi:hypothetical protein